MNEFTEVRYISLSFDSTQLDPQDHSKRLLSKEWLIKIDNEKSVPYLMVRSSVMGKVMACSMS